MKSGRWIKVGLLLVVLTSVILFSCATRKALSPYSGDPESGLLLQYMFPQDRALTYELLNEISQEMEIMGQTNRMNMKTTYTFQVRSKGRHADYHDLDISLSDMGLDISGSQGSYSPNVSSIIGKKFAMTVSPVGKELDLSEAEAITYDLGQAGPRSISSDFQTIFPDLADRPVKIGDSWVSRDTIVITSGTMDMSLMFDNVNTLEGVETVNGHECIRVAVEVSGTLTGSGNQGGVDLDMDGDIAASEIWYYAYKEGYFVKWNSDGETTGKILASGPQNFTIPMTMTTKSRSVLLD